MFTTTHQHKLLLKNTHTWSNLIHLHVEGIKACQKLNNLELAHTFTSSNKHYQIGTTNTYSSQNFRVSKTKNEAPKHKNKINYPKSFKTSTFSHKDYVTCLKRFH